MHVRRILASLSVACVALLSSGCASIIKGGGSQSINIRSTPAEASVKVYDAETGNLLSDGKTPTIVSLNKSRGYFSGGKYRVVLEKQGFVTREAIIDSSPNGWYIAGNLVFGGLIGWLVVDPATGAMWSLEPDELSVELQPSAPAPADKPVALLTIDELAAEHPELLARLHPVLPQ